MKLILGYIRKHLGIFLLSTLFLTMEAMADLFQPTFMSMIVDRGIQNADVSRILFYGLCMLGIAMTGAACAVMRNRFASRVSQTIGKELRRDIYHNVQLLSMENIDRLRPASIITRITNDVVQVQEFINGIMRIMVKAPITCIGAVILILIQTPRQAPVMAGILVVAAVLILGNMRIGYPRFGTVQKRLDRLNGVTREFLSSVRVVKAFHAEEKEGEKFEEVSLEYAGANTAALRTMAVFSPLINLTVNFGIVLLLWISGSSRGVELGRLMASVNYMTQVLFAVGMISNTLNVAVRATASSERIKEVLEEKPVQQMPANPLKPEIQGNIRMEHVSFAYGGTGKQGTTGIGESNKKASGKKVESTGGSIGGNGASGKKVESAGGSTGGNGASGKKVESAGGSTGGNGASGKKVESAGGSIGGNGASDKNRASMGGGSHEKEALHDINLQIYPGETIGIIGATGSGKTTFVNLIPRLYDATEGKVWIDGCDVTQIDTKLLRAAIAVVPQKALLFSGTIRENLRWGCEDAGEKELYRAARIACAASFIEQSPQGYDTLLGQGGVNLSGGQKQRISLARALVRNPRILILDDCTSALDAQTESEVLKGLRDMGGRATVLLVSQRISTVMRTDHILCMDNGYVQGYGTHDELMDSCKTYQEIYHSQIGNSLKGV